MASIRFPKSNQNADLSSIANLFLLLGRIWAREIDAQLLEELRTDPLKTSLEEIGLPLPQESELEELAVEYCRLFIGPQQHFPPLQSVWVKGQLASEITTSVEQLADVLGGSAELATRMPDHLGNQFLLMGRAVQMLERSEAGTVEFQAAIEVAERVFECHITWCAPFLKAIHKQASPFYSQVAKVTFDFIVMQEELWMVRDTSSQSS